MAKKVFWHTVGRLRGKRSLASFSNKDSNGVFLKHQDVILNRWREYFRDLLNLVDIALTQTHEGQVGKIFR